MEPSTSGSVAAPVAPSIFAISISTACVIIILIMRQCKFIMWLTLVCSFFVDNMSGVIKKSSTASKSEPLQGKMAKRHSQILLGNVSVNLT